MKGIEIPPFDFFSAYIYSAQKIFCSNTFNSTCPNLKSTLSFSLSGALYFLGRESRCKCFQVCEKNGITFNVSKVYNQRLNKPFVKTFPYGRHA